MAKKFNRNKNLQIIILNDKLKKNHNRKKIGAYAGKRFHWDEPFSKINLEDYEFNAPQSKYPRYLTPHQNVIEIKEEQKNYAELKEESIHSYSLSVDKQLLTYDQRESFSTNDICVPISYLDEKTSKTIDNYLFSS